MDTIKIEDFAKLDLRVVTITAAEPVAGADRLLKLTVNDGSPEPRIVLAGVKKQFPDPAVLVNTQVVIVANLEPKTMKGIESRGMILAAADRSLEHPDIQLLSPRNPIAAGAGVG